MRNILFHKGFTKSQFYSKIIVRVSNSLYSHKTSKYFALCYFALDKATDGLSPLSKLSSAKLFV